MGGQISEEQVVNASLRGIIAAQKDYMEWSGEWLWQAPEYLSTIYVAREIGKLGLGLTLEHSVNSTINHAGARGRGRLNSDIRADGRFDILIWSNELTPAVPIEVKCQVKSIYKIRNDITNIVSVLNTINTRAERSLIKFGMVVFYLSYESQDAELAKEIIERSFRNIARRVANDFGEQCASVLHSTEIYTDATFNSAWAGAALVLKDKEN